MLAYTLHVPRLGVGRERRVAAAADAAAGRRLVNILDDEAIW